MARPLRELGIVAALALPSLSAFAETPTAFVEPPQPDSVRAIGLAGAFVGLADDSSTTIWNPAGLCRVPRSLEVVLGTLSDEDDWRAFGSAGGRPTRRLAVGAQLAKPPVGIGHLLRNGESTPSEAKTTDMALGAALLISSQRELSAGASLQRRQLSIDGFSAEDAWSWSVGMLFRPVNPWSPRLGLSYRHKTDWDLSIESAVHHVRAVSVFSAGASWYYEPQRWFRLAISLQPDLVLYSQLQDDDDGRPQPRDDVDLRTAVEATIPFDCWTGCGSMVQLRAGLLNSAALPLAAPLLAATEDLPRRRTSWSFGMAIAHQGVLHGRLKLEAAYDRRSKSFAFGVGFRFPEAFRAEIVDTTRRAR